MAGLTTPPGSFPATDPGKSACEKTQSVFTPSTRQNQYGNRNRRGLRAIAPYGRPAAGPISTPILDANQS
jgi:hypothetical protein